jgi:hypothetical protein
MRNRLVVLAAAMVFAASVASVAFVAGRDGDGGPLEKLPVAAGADQEAGAAGGTSRSAGLANDDATFSIAPVTIEYRLAGPLPELAGTAPAYRLGSTTSRAEVARLAKALGLDGEVVEQAERYVVRAGNRELSVERQPGLPWNLGFSCMDTPVSSDADPETAVKCAAASGELNVTVDDSAVSGLARPAPTAAPPGAEPAGAGAPDRPPVSVLPVPAPCPPDAADCLIVEPGVAPPPLPPRPADLPSRAEAEAQAKALFTALGTGLGSFEISDGFDAWYASVQPTVGGLKVGWATSVAVGPKGVVQWANGFLATPERIGDYPLVGVQRGFERLQEMSRRWSGGGTGSGGGSGGDVIEPLVLDAPLRGAPEPAVDLPAVQSPVGGPPSGEPFVQTVRTARLGLQFLGDRLVPVYVFELVDGGTAEAPAVVDELLEEHPIAGR